MTDKLSQEELLEWLEEKLEYLENRKIKPGHGICCTCQRCGHEYDDCECGDREVYQQIKELIKKPKVTQEVNMELKSKCCGAKVRKALFSSLVERKYYKPFYICDMCNKLTGVKSHNNVN